MEENKDMIQNTTEEESQGTVKISEEVVSIIAGMAASGVEGVYSMSGTVGGGLSEFFGVKKNSSKGIKVDIDGQIVTIDIHISVVYGNKIPEIAWEIQEKVKASVEETTGLTVEKVNIHVDGINFDKSKKEPEEVIVADAEPIAEDEEKTE